MALEPRTIATGRRGSVTLWLLLWRDRTGLVNITIFETREQFDRASDLLFNSNLEYVGEFEVNIP